MLLLQCYIKDVCETIDKQEKVVGFDTLHLMLHVESSPEPLVHMSVDPHLKQKCLLNCKWATVRCVSRSYVASGRLLQNGLIYICCVDVVLIALTMLTSSTLFSFRQGIHLVPTVHPEFLAVLHEGAHK